MDNKEALIREIISRSEMRLLAQQQIALAADTRAMQLMAICVAGASLAVAAAGGKTSWPHLAIACVLVVAAAFAGWSARPLKWHAPGAVYSDFATDIDSNRCVVSVLMELAQHQEEGIKINEDISSENANSVRVAVMLAILAPVVGIATYLVTG